MSRQKTINPSSKPKAGRRRPSFGQRLLLSLLAVVFASSAWAVEPVHGVAMHGSPKYPPDFTHFDYVNPDAPKGGAVTLGETGGFDSFNPFIIKGNPVAGIGGLYDRLLAQSQDEPFSKYGWLAENMEMPEDRSWIIFNLRKQARWHDGTPITADDVVFTYEIQLEQGTPTFKFYYAGIDKVEKLGPHRVKFTFNGGENRELPLIIGDVPILPKHYWESRDFSKTTLEPPLGSGPFRIAAFEANRYVEYERVKDYWGKDLPVNRGRFNFDSTRYEYYKDRIVELEAFKTGSMDIRLENSAKNWATAYDFPAVRDGLMIKEEIHHSRSTGMQGFLFNTRLSKFADPKIRQAIAFAYDFEWANKTLFFGQYKRTRSYFENSELAATGLPEGEELKILESFRGRIPEEVFTTEYQPPATKGDGRIRANIRKALELAEEAGWVLRDGILTEKSSGQTLEIEFLILDPQFERIVLPYIKNLRRMGIIGRARTVDQAQYIKRMETFDFEMMVLSYGQSLSPGNEQRTYWGSEAADTPGSRNLIGIKDPVVDALIDLVIQAPDREQLVARTKALDRVLQWGHYLVPNWHIGFDRIAYWDKFGRPAVTPLRGFQNDTWWIDPVKEAALKEKRGR